MESPPFQSGGSAIPSAILSTDPRKLLLLNSRLHDGDPNSRGAEISTGFRNSPTLREVAETTTLEDNFGLKPSREIFEGEGFREGKPGTPHTDIESGNSKSCTGKEDPSAEKLSGTKRTLEEAQETQEEATKERAFTEKKSPQSKRGKSSREIVLLEDSNHHESNQGETNSRGPIQQVPGQSVITRFFGTADQVRTTVFPVVATATTASSTQVAPATTKAKTPKEKPEKAVTAPSAVPENQAAYGELKRQADSLRIGKEQAELRVAAMEAQQKSLSDRLKASEERSTRLTKSLEDVHRRMALQEFRRKRDQLALDCVRLGKITTVRTGPTSLGDIWEEGYAMKDVAKRQAELLERKEELEARKKKVKSLATKRTKRSNAAAASGEDDSLEVDVDLDLAAEQEVLKMHIEILRRDESSLAEERRMLESEKAVHMKELKRCQCEERSRFYKDLPCLNDRYLLQQMLGRGGFSEVWKALDLIDLREVAVKVHQLNPQWSEERKASYIKHVTREYTIHRDMKHPRVVQLFEVFEIDINSFATVLEYCRGIDLDEKLKRFKTIAEKDAKSIFMQILSGLRYLHHPYSYSTGGLYLGDGEMADGMAASGVNANGNNNGSNNPLSDGLAMGSGNGLPGNKKISIIHFDLKPANILFDEMGDVKITDFGLSKIIDESHEGTSMELTSQGAGTYWYLPPECFEKGPNPPRISSKVDVWSAGIIFYQMLYGSRPFGEGKTQENVWTENLIFNASGVDFPSDAKAPKVSDEAKELIRMCLTRDQRLRPDVVGICQHAYFKGGK